MERKGQMGTEFNGLNSVPKGSNMKIKICGLTEPKEAEYVNEHQVDFIGMVLFFPKSKRNITLERAKEIMKCLDPGIQKVAVVVSPVLEQVQMIEQAGFDYIQIHGEIPPGYSESCHLPVLKAFNIRDMKEFPRYSADPAVAGYVFDAAEPGSGKVFDWSLVKEVPRNEKLFFLAGGLNPDNVAEAIRSIHPDGVDVSSGVEYGRERTGKDPEKVRKFVEAAWEANDQVYCRQASW